MIIASNRGPVEFFRESGAKIGMKKGAGGIVPTLFPIMENVGGIWIASAMNNTDMEMANKYPDGISISSKNPKFKLQLIDLNREKYDAFYNTFINPLLWFIHHYMWDLANKPKIDEEVHKAWQSYEYVNQKFADKIIEEINSSKNESVVMLQDIHLQTCPSYIREMSEDVFLSQFIHIPWPQPDYFGILPEYMQDAIVKGLLANDILGFHIKRYVKNFLMICEKYADDVDFKNNIVHYNDHKINVNNYPISVDISGLNQLAKTDEVLKKEEYVKKIKGNNFLIYRTERTDPSKNILRGFKAYELFLQENPEFQGKVTFFVTGMSTRENVKEYRDYKRKVNDIIHEINEKFSKNDWKPIVTHFNAEYSLVTAALKNYDCLLVNSIHDGMNIVPKEGAVLNENNGILILSETTGAHEELKEYSLNINALDISRTAEAIHKAVIMDQNERENRLKGLKEIINQYDVYNWIIEQFNDIQKLF